VGCAAHDEQHVLALHGCRIIRTGGIEDENDRASHARLEGCAQRGNAVAVTGDLRPKRGG